MTEQTVGATQAAERVLLREMLSVPAILIHGGAGTFERLKSPEDERHLEKALSKSLDAGWALLERGEPAIEAVVEAVACLEDSGVFNAGGSGTRTEDGRLELDASVMDGATGSFGGVCAATWPRNPVRVRRSRCPVSVDQDPARSFSLARARTEFARVHGTSRDGEREERPISRGGHRRSCRGGLESPRRLGDFHRGNGRTREEAGWGTRRSRVPEPGLTTRPSPFLPPVRARRSCSRGFLTWSTGSCARARH